MKKTNKLFYFISIPFIILFINFTSTYAGDIDNSDQFNNSLVTINSNRDIYLESEPIWIEVDVNIPTKYILDRAPDIHPYGDLRFYLTDKSGDTIKDLGGNVTSVLVKKYRRHYYNIFYLNNYYGIPEDSSLDFPYKTPTGEYHLQISLQLQITDSLKYFYSNIINFKVEKPTGDELNARNKLIEIEYLTFKSGNSMNVVNTRYAKIDEFRKIYYYSRYIQKVENLNFYNSWSDPDFKDSIKTYLSRRIREDVNNYYNIIYVYNLGAYFKGNENYFIDELNKIEVSHRGTILQKIIESYTEEFNFKKSLQKSN